MLLPRWSRSGKKRRSQSAFHLTRRESGFEYLEMRRVLATVTLNTDTGIDGELRTEIADAAPGETIVFNLADGDETVLLNMAFGELVIDKDLSIDGDNELGSGTDVTISGDDSVRVFNVDDGNATSAVASLANLTITGGRASEGGGIQNSEALTLTNTTVSGNTATGGTGGGINSIGYGSYLNLVGSTVDGNYAYGTGLGDRQNYLTFTPATGGGVFASLGSLSISGSTISNNTASGPDGTDMAGGGVAVTSNGPDGQFAPVNVTVTGTTISGNVVVGEALRVDEPGPNCMEPPCYYGVDPYGGGFYAAGYGQVTISDTMVTGNTAAGLNNNYGNGGGASFFASGGGFSEGSAGLNVDINDAEISGNYASSRAGGISAHRSQFYDGSLQLNITGSTISDNQAIYYGGAFFSFGRAAAPGTFVTTITGSTISGNTAGSSGGLSAWDSHLYLKQSVVSGNEAIGTPYSGFDYGGGVTAYSLFLYDYDYDTMSYVRNENYPARVVVENSTISGNSAAGNGGGVNSVHSTLEIIQSTISGNTAGVDGAGLHLYTNSNYGGYPYAGTTTIDRSTITLNNSSGVSGRGGGIFVTVYESYFTMSNSIVSGNSATTYGPDVYDYVGTKVSSNTTFSLIGNNDYSGFAEANPGPEGNGNIVGGSGASSIDARLGPLDLGNGGPTPTHLPYSDSPVIDMADSTVLPGTSTDQRGFQRVVDGDMSDGPRMDMGSVEYGAVPVVDGDFDDNGRWDCADINMLTAETAAMTNNLLFDLTSDELVNELDIAAWLIEGGAMNADDTGGNPFLPGDVNLDGVVDGQDFIDWNSHKFTSNTNWCDGNLNGDSVVDGQDFIIWNTFKFMSSSMPAPNRASSVLFNEVVNMPREAARNGREQFNQASFKSENGVVSLKSHLPANRPAPFESDLARQEKDKEETKTQKMDALDDVFDAWSTRIGGI